jgi:hypothetical protein
MFAVGITEPSLLRVNVENYSVCREHLASCTSKGRASGIVGSGLLQVLEPGTLERDRRGKYPCKQMRGQQVS